ncbi:FtsK/SpoIIIE domain-containing protein [Bacillus marasmi]|uniref:FtsK/SpoIIIE domain-containing protein n=1 Tax=Bacillus marasmi TaxID=1926279 RepID=UPI00164E565C|nr:FtsK/SpoIIIE domain-containing protein [Bacillus marasmi]
MLFEIASATMFGGLAGLAFLKKSALVNDAEKIQKICYNCKLTVKENGDIKTIQLHRKEKHDWGTEYVYRIPLGLSFSDFEGKLDHIRDGLNNKKTYIDFKRFLQLNFETNLLTQIRDIFQTRSSVHQKDVELEFDGMLRVKVLCNDLPTNLLFDETMLDECSNWEIPLGQTRYGFITHDLEQGHITLAGATRKGKTVLLKLIISTVIHQNPEHVKLSLIDLKGGLAFTRFKNAKQVESVATDLESALEVLTKVKNEMKETEREFDQNGCEDIKEAGIRTRHIIVVDEAAQISPNIVTGKDKKEKAKQCEEALSEIARIGAGLGYRLIYCSQYPKAEVMNAQIKQNCDTVITYKLRDAVASRVVLDESGAESLPIPGRAIYKTPDGTQIVQTPFIDNDQIDKLIKPHIVIRPRKEQRESDIGERKTRRSDTFELTEM